jgi:hypothetical protein
MAKRSVKSQYVGIDVSAKTLQVAIGGPDGVRDLEIRTTRLDTRSCASS